MPPERDPASGETETETETETDVEAPALPSGCATCQFGRAASGRATAGAGADLAAGSPVADVELVELMGISRRVCSWRARRADGSGATAHVVCPQAGQATRDHFLAVASDLAAQQKSRSIEGMLKITAVDPLAGAYVGDCVPLGTMTDLPLLKWDADQQLEFAWRICAILQRMHGAGMVHGFLRPDNVLLDDDLRPVVTNTQAVDLAAECEDDEEAAKQLKSFTAPEVRAGSEADEHSDVYGVGRLLHFMLLGEPPNERDEELPRLDSLAKSPPGLVRIIRKCTAFDSEQRYTNMAALRADLDRYRADKPAGLRHPEIDDVARFSGRPDVHERATDSSSLLKISLKPQKRAADQAAERLSKSPKAQPEGPKPAVLRWTRGRAVGLAIVGLALVAGSTWAAYHGGASSLVLFAGSLLGAALLGIAPPGYGASPKLSRLLNMLLCLTAAFLLDPVSRAADKSPRLDGLAAASVADRVAALKELRATGETKFTSLDLSAADLSHADLTGTILDGSKLTGANCRSTDLSRASLLNVDVANADFTGAELDGVNATFLRGWDRAKCDDSTTMPTGWRCSKGSPQSEQDAAE